MGKNGVTVDTDKVSAVKIGNGVVRVAALGRSLYLNYEEDKFELCTCEGLLYSNFDYDQELQEKQVPDSFRLSEYEGGLEMVKVDEDVNAVALRRGYFYFNPTSGHDFSMCKTSAARYSRRHPAADGTHLPSVPSLHEMGEIGGYCGENAVSAG